MPTKSWLSSEYVTFGQAGTPFLDHKLTDCVSSVATDPLQPAAIARIAQAHFSHTLTIFLIRTPNTLICRQSHHPVAREVASIPIDDSTPTAMSGGRRHILSDPSGIDTSDGASENLVQNHKREDRPPAMLDPSQEASR